MSEKDDKNKTNSRFIVNPVTGEKRNIIGAFYDIVCKLEQHYDGLQNEVKNFSMTWLGAGFFAVGYVIKTFDAESLFSEPLVLFFIFNLVAFGFYIQWFYDVSIYHRQLKAVFLSLTEYEEKFPHLGRKHQKMAEALEDRQKGLDPVRNHGKFYFRIILPLIFLGIATLFPHIFHKEYWEDNLMIYAAIALLLMHAFLLIVFCKATKRSGASHGTNTTCSPKTDS